MTPDPSAPGELGEARYLLTPRAIRDRAEAMYALAQDGELSAFTVDESKLDPVTELVVEVTREAYPDVASIPYHARYRHFGAGGVDRLARLEGLLAAKSNANRFASRVELVVTSVLLDAGAGPGWAYRDGTGRSYARSEGLAVASYDLFERGGLSGVPSEPLRVDADALARLSVAELARAFQVTDDNPLVGLEGRVRVLQRLGEVVSAKPEYFGHEGRLGHLGNHLLALAPNGTLEASAVLGAVLAALGEIWPGRESSAGINLGDVWRHPALGRVPFHKLSQWLTYSLVEPLEQAGVRVVELDQLTGLAEYRNGGLFVDGGVLVPKFPGVVRDVHTVSSTVVVEWRALTIALLDRTAAAMRRRLGLSSEALPLAKVLEGGTWSAGRKLAAEKRPGGTPPIRVESDGTVF